MTTKRVTPKDLADVVKQYNGYLEKIAFPYPYRSWSTNGSQQLQIVRTPSTTVDRIESGTSRECIAALYRNYNKVYEEAMSGVLIITHIEPLSGVKHETKATKPFDYKDMSAHQAARNIMLSCGLWQIWYTLNGVYFSQTVNQAWK